MIATILEGDADHVHVLHSLSKFPGSVTNPTAYDDLVVGVLGDGIDASALVALPDEAFGRITAVWALQSNVIVGNTGHLQAPPRLRLGPHAPNTPDTDEIRARRAFLMDPKDSVRALTSQPLGRYTLPAFYTTFIAPGLANPDPAIQTATHPIRDWFRLASTNATGDLAVLRVTPVADPLPVNGLSFNRALTRVKTEAKRKLGGGGPGLTTTAFETGIQTIRDALTATSENHLTYERSKAQKSYTDRHGTAMAERLYRLTGVNDDDHLPEIHRVLASTPKNRESGVLQSFIDERVGPSGVGLTHINAPIATAKLLEDVYRSYQPGGPGHAFATGLSPFAVVCIGHAEADKAQKLVKQAAQAQSGVGMTLADAEILTSTDLRLPTEPQIAAEKLYGWSVNIDIFHGVNHAISQSVRTFVKTVGPCLFAVHRQGADNSILGMDLVNRVLFEAQQEYFQYLGALGRGVANVQAPTFGMIIDAATPLRASSLAKLPQTWYSMFDVASGSGGAAQGGSTLIREQAGAVAAFNSHADSALVSRFNDSPHTKGSNMLQGNTVSIPKHNDKPVCLVWALTGSCTSACKRKENHVRYPRSVVTQLHSLMDACGVANPQA